MDATGIVYLETGAYLTTIFHWWSDRTRVKYGAPGYGLGSPKESVILQKGVRVPLDAFLERPVMGAYTRRAKLSGRTRGYASVRSDTFRTRIHVALLVQSVLNTIRNAMPSQKWKSNARWHLCMRVRFSSCGSCLWKNVCPRYRWPLLPQEHGRKSLLGALSPWHV